MAVEPYLGAQVWSIGQAPASTQSSGRPLRCHRCLFVGEPSLLFVRMVLINSLGGRCSALCLEFGFLMSRLHSAASSSVADTFQARSFSARFDHQARHSANASKGIEAVLVYCLRPSGGGSSKYQTSAVGPLRSKKRMFVGIEVYGAKTPLGRRTTVCRLKLVISSCLIRPQTPSPKRVPLGTTTAARPGFGCRRNFRMMSCKKSRAVSAVCLSAGKQGSRLRSPVSSCRYRAGFRNRGNCRDSRPATVWPSCRAGRPDESSKGCRASVFHRWPNRGSGYRIILPLPLQPSAPEMGIAFLLDR